MICPKDANHWLEHKSICRRKILVRKKDLEEYHTDGDYWYCTRLKNHYGKHHAHARGGVTCIRMFTEEEAIVEAL